MKLSIRNWKLKDKKLVPRWIRPFKIIEVIGNQTYRLTLLEQYVCLYDVFLIQLLEKYHPRNKDDLIFLPELKDEDKEYEVEEVKDKNLKKKYIRYLVKWFGWFSE